MNAGSSLSFAAWGLLAGVLAMGCTSKDEASDGGSLGPRMVAATPYDRVVLTLDDESIYWLGVTSGTAPPIKKTPLRGGATVTLAEGTPSTLDRLVVDETHVYWGDRERLYRVAKAGGDRQVVTEASVKMADGGMEPVGRLPFGVALDDGSLYLVYSPDLGKPPSIASVPSGGGTLTVTLGPLMAYGVVSDFASLRLTPSTFVLAGEASGLALVPKNAPDSLRKFEPRRPLGLTLHEGYAYWSSDARVLRVALEAGEPETVLERTRTVSGFGLTGSELVWSENEEVWTRPIAGGEPLRVASSAAVRGLTARGHTIAWSTGDGITVLDR